MTESDMMTASYEAFMPDWSYRTVLRPVLFRLPVAFARDLSLSVVGALGRSRVGVAVIDFLGHMRAAAPLQQTHMGITFPTAVGLGCGLDPEARGTNALSRFGVGFIEIGPITLQPAQTDRPTLRHDVRESIVTPELPDNPGLTKIALQLARTRPRGVPLLVRLTVTPGTPPGQATDECRQMIELLAPYAHAFSLMTVGPHWDEGAIREHFGALGAALRRCKEPRALLACVAPDLGQEAAERLALVAQEAGVDGLLVDGALRASPERREMGLPAREPAMQTVAWLRKRCGSSLTIVASGGVHEPEDALHLIEAGADLVEIDSGLVFTGPGLPKRVNDALLFATTAVGLSKPEGASPPPTEQTWFWTLLMGVGMLFGSTLAAAIAMTRVVLPYDEEFVGLTRSQLMAINARILPFMAHDRVTLAGTMITVGMLYTGLSLGGIRRGLHWARVAVLSSAVVGFGSFFLFLGFGYFDPFHAFVTAILFQFLLLALHCRTGEPHGLPPPGLRNDGSWRLAQWGQLALVAHGTALIAAGLVISFIGATSVFVPEDLEFMRTSALALRTVSSRLVPLVAHDRASFGGMLVVSGMTFLMASLWGFRRGMRWLWWTILLSGLPGYTAAIGIHYAVGYHNPFHLAPAFAGLALFATGMALSYPYLCGADATLDAAWKNHRLIWTRLRESSSAG